MGPSNENMGRPAHGAPFGPQAYCGIQARGSQLGTQVEGRSAAPEALESDEARNLLEAAQAAGSVNQEEIALALDELDLDAGQVDDFYRTLEELQVEVVAPSDTPDEPEVTEAEVR